MKQLIGSGLPNVFLRNGFTITKDEDGEWMSVADVDGLYLEIARAVATKPALLTGLEVRFIRKRLGVSQSELGARLGKTDQAVAIWEKGASIPASEDRNIRSFWLAKHCPSELAGIYLRHSFPGAEERPYEFIFDGRKWRLAGEMATVAVGHLVLDHASNAIQRVMNAPTLSALSIAGSTSSYTSTPGAPRKSGSTLTSA